MFIGIYFRDIYPRRLPIIETFLPSFVPFTSTYARFLGGTDGDPDQSLAISVVYLADLLTFVLIFGSLCQKRFWVRRLALCLGTPTVCEQS